MLGAFQSVVFAASLVTGQAARPEKSPTATRVGSVLQKRVSLSVKDGDIVEALRKIFDSAGANYVIQAGVHGKTTATLTNVAFQRALAALIRASNPRVILRFDGTVYTVEPWVNPWQGGGAGFGRYGDWDYRDIKVQVNFVK